MTTTNITDSQIRNLRTAAGEHGDMAQVVICDLAMGSLGDDGADYEEPVGNLRIVADYYTAVSQWEMERLRKLGFDAWTSDEARAECARVISDAEAQR